MNKSEITPSTVGTWLDDCVFGFSINQIDELTKIINKYCLPRPIYKDGTPIQFGDKFTERTFSRENKVVRISYFISASGESCEVNGFNPDDLNRDSWEKLEADAKSSFCAYCNKAKTQDIIRRAKKLAGVCID